MLALLARRFVKNHDSPADPEVRRGYGTLCGVFGICLNLLLVLAKLLVGRLTGSLAITGDALNNLADAGSSGVTLLGFRLAARQPDPDHPFGHGRIEYLSGLAVAAAVVLTGVELARSSVAKILAPEPVVFSYWSVAVLVLGIAVKLYMAHYNRAIGAHIGSSAMKATALDCLSDCAATGAVLAGTLLERFFGWQLDGWLGALVSLLILWAGIQAARDTISPLLGERPDPELVAAVKQTVLSYEPVIGVHDLIVHDYGPGRRVISLHAEVPCKGDLLAMHDAIDNAESELRARFSCTAVIHMDPVETDNEAVAALRMQVAALVHGIDPRFSIHDFRMVSGPTHTNLIFDLVLPFGLPQRDEDIVAAIRARIASLDPCYQAVITVDKELS